MIKESLMQAADSAFTFIGAVLMRRAVARLARMPDDALADAGLSRAAVAEFLAAPLGTDPGSFFARRGEQAKRRLNADGSMITHSPPAPLPARRHADGAIDYNFYRARAVRLRRQAIRNAVKRLAALRLGAVAAALIMALRALNGAARTTAPAYVAARAGQSGTPRLSVALAQDALHSDARDGPTSRRHQFPVTTINHPSREGQFS